MGRGMQVRRDWRTLGPLWENLAMGALDRFLAFENILPNEPVAARCSGCSQLFIVKWDASRATGDGILQIRAQFNTLKCKEDASQASTFGQTQL